MMFATAGGSIKLWDAQNYKQCQEILSVNGRVADVSWSQNGQCIAFLGENVPDISLFGINAKSATNIGIVRGMDSPSCIQFPCRSSHYLGVGNKDGSVVLWNLKSNSRKKTFMASDSSISNIVFSHNDSHVAAASKGNLCLLSLMNNSVSGPFKIFENQAITDVSYSRVKKSLIGCCSDGGSLSLFDAHASKLIHSFSGAHSAPVAAVAFSPINEILTISVGYDKKLICYNIQTKKQVLNHKSSEPLSSAAFLSDGQRIALGSMTGQVFIHDLRNVRMPLATLAAHDKAVTSILLQPASKSIPRSEGACKDVKTLNPKPKKNPEVPKVIPSESVETPSEAATLETIPSSISTMPSIPVVNPSQDVFTLFSPVRPTGEAKDGNSVSSQQKTVNTDSVILDSAFSPVCLESRDSYFADPTKKLEAVMCDGIFSPVREAPQNSGVANNIYDESPSQQKDEMGMPSNIKQIAKIQLKTTAYPEEEYPRYIPSPHGDQKENTDPNTSAVSTSSQRKEHNSIPESILISEEKIVPKHILSPVQATETPKCNIISSPSRMLKISEFEIPGYQISMPSVSGDIDYTGSEMAGSYSKNTSNEKIESTLRSLNKVQLLKEESETPAVYQGASDDRSASQLQVDLIRNCMAEVVEELQDDFNRRLMHLQYVVTKQFLQLKETMQNLQQQSSLNKELLLEYEQLQKENARLRANF